MDCNKEEAVRAMGLAVKKLHDSDFLGARKFGQRAQQLFPELENITQLLSVCDVHCSASKKLNGSETDWYGVLQVAHTADETTIRKQYRKLALLLHPDKNKLAGAEAAFKLIGEASRLLTDQAKRSVYDMKIRVSVRTTAPRPPPAQVNRPAPPSRPYGTYPPNFYQNAQPTVNTMLTFWTCCPFCNMRYQYYRDIMNKSLRCQTCSRPFVAYDLHSQATTTAFVFNQTTAPNQKEVPRPQASKQDAPKANFENTVKHPPSFQGSSDVKTSSVFFQPVKPNDINSAKARAEAEPVQAQNVKNGGVKPDKSPKKAGTKRGKKFVVESSASDEESSGSEEEVELEHNEGNPAGDMFGSGSDCNLRRSFRKKQHVSYNENISDEEGIGTSQKRSRKTGLDTNNQGTSSHDVSKACSVGTESEMRVEENDNDDEDSSSQPNPIIYDAHDPEFNDFEKYRADECFAVDQIWAIFDSVDCMPRYYARVRKVFPSQFKLRMTWLEPTPVDQDEIYWVNQDLPVACGRYKAGQSIQTTDKPMFSHLVQTVSSNTRSYVIYPMKGEIWALFRNWDMSWSHDAENHKEFKFEIVEIASNVTDSGILVSYLEKVKGFVSLFRQRPEGVASFHIPLKDKYRFSHRITSFKMNGTEREGVPKDSFELDPASLSDDMVGRGHDSGKPSDNGSVAS